MRTVSLVLGIISISVMVLALIPCLGWINWFNIPVALAGLIIGIVAYSKNNYTSKSKEVTGIILCSVALLLGFLRLVLGLVLGGGII